MESHKFELFGLEWISFIDSSFTPFLRQPPDKHLQVPMRLTTFPDAVPHPRLEIKGSNLVASTSDQLLYLAGNLLSTDNATSTVGFQAQPHLPEVTDVALIEELVGEVGPAEERDPTAEAFDHGVPPAVAEEAGYRRVPEDSLLRGPPHHLPPVSHLLREALRAGCGDACAT